MAAQETPRFLLDDTVGVYQTALQEERLQASLKGQSEKEAKGRAERYARYWEHRVILIQGSLIVGTSRGISSRKSSRNPHEWDSVERRIVWHEGRAILLHMRSQARGVVKYSTVFGVRYQWNSEYLSPAEVEWATDSPASMTWKERRMVAKYVPEQGAA